MEIKNKLTVPEGKEGLGAMGEKKGRVKSGNMYEGSINKDNARED